MCGAPEDEEKVPMVSLVAVLRMLTGEGSMDARAVRKRRRSRARGVTLIEVMIVVVILGLIAGGVAVAVFPKFTEAQIKTTRTSAMELRRATETWRATHASDQCPTLEQLKQDKAVDSASKLTDAWDDPFKVVCQDDETVVISYGHDKKEGTPDDIVVPEQSSDQK
jgi:general secretion pathway protein G